MEEEIKEAVRNLQNLLRINTTNPPGNEIAACRYIADIFDKEGISYQILESAPTRANIIARIEGDGSEKPLLLTSHLDVVPCERDKWDEDPFGGEIKDGYIWGRGAVDMKQMTALELAVFLKAHREKTPLKRDLIFAAVADEEAGCTYGSKWLVENHPDLVRAEYAVNEVGGFSLHVNDSVFYPIGVAEKGLCWFKIIAKGDPGHGAMPHDNQAIPHLCFAGQQLAENKLPFHSTELVTQFVSELAKRQKFPKNIILNSIKNRFLHGFILNNLFPDKARARVFKNMFRNLGTPTQLKAGYKENVIPSEAELVVDGRFLPCSTVESFLQEVKDLIGPNFDIEVIQAEEANQTDYDNSFFETLKETLSTHHPGSIPVPFLISGFTDAKHYAKLGIKCYGFAPTKISPELNFAAMFHGHNERIPVDSLDFGVRVMWDMILKTCC